MANFPSLVYSFFNILLIKFSVHRRTSKKTRRGSILPVESPCEDGTGEIQISAAYSLWSQLDKDILYLIIEKLDLFSCVRFSAVCKSWLIAIEESRTPDPVLRLLPRNPYSEHLAFSDFHTGAVYEFSLPDSVKGKWSWCISSSDGRCIVVITSYRQSFRNLIGFFLFDPISRSLLRLPKINDSRIRASITRSRKKLVRDNFLLKSKFEIFSVGGSQKVIAWTYGGWYLAFCKSGGKKWYQFQKLLEGGYLDICFVNGTLYVLTSYPYGVCSENDSSIGVAIRTRSMKFEGLEITVKLVPNSVPGRGCLSISNFVNFNGELLRVHKLCNIAQLGDLLGEEDDDALKYFQWYRSSEFLLSKFEHRSDDDNKMFCTKLSGLGHEALLFGPCNCICIPVKKFRGAEENCIYFLNEFCGLRYIVCNEFGVCHMDNGRIESTSLACYPRPEKGHGLYCWFLPRIKKGSVPLVF